MSPKEARVFVAEDDPEFRDHYERRLKRSGHTVVMTANTLPEALNQVGRLKEEGVQVAVVDGNLTAGGWDGTDGAEVVRAIREKAPTVKIVGMSADIEGVQGVDVNLGKRRLLELGETVTNL